ncbi:MAG: hypothetical protein E7403_00495 [Ruminococcaceae bacterium]|nr:hypothetical protein [Oscillospiraceae bacterium]
MKLVKKLTALLCAVLCIASLCAVSAEEVATTVDNDFTPGKSGTFFAWVWEKTSGADNLYQPFTLRNTATTAANRVNYKDGAIETARKMKTYFDTIPDGKRAVNPFNSLSEGTRAETNAFWYDGIPKYEALMDEIIYYYKRLGGKPIDAVVCDHESACNVWYQESNASKRGMTMDQYYALAETDPRYPELRQSVIDYGIPIYEGDDHPELYHLYAYANTGELNSPVKQHVYNGIGWAGEWFMENCMEKVYQVWKKHYPDISFSDYGSGVSAEPSRTSSAAGHMYGLYREATPMEERKIVGGTHVSPNFYLRVDKGLEGAPPPDYPYATYYSTPFNTILLNLVSAQSNVLYLPGQRYFRPWVGSYTWSYNNRGPAAATDYYKEFIYHLGLLESDQFLFYNYEAGNEGIDDNLVFSELLKDLDYMIGFEDRKTLIKDFTPWDSRYILTGMSAGGKNVWRITPDMSTADVPTIESFKVSDNPLTFRIGQQTVEFPEGSYIYEPSGEREFAYSKAGYWVITPEGTEPTEYIDDTQDEAAEPGYLFGGAEEVDARVKELLAEMGSEEEEEPAIVKDAFAEEFRKKFKNTYKTVFVSKK